MAKLGISTGTTPNDGTGDNLLSGAVKINANFSEIYSAIGDGTNITNSINYASTAGIATYSGTSGIATYASTAGIATYSGTSGIATYASTAGIATYSGTSGIATYASTAGIATYSGTSGISTVSQGLTGTPNITVGIVTATSFFGSGTNLTGIVTSIVAGTGVTISGSTGQVTINATGGSGTSYWSQTSAGINTLSNVGIGTTNPRFALEVGAVGASGTSLLVNGNARITGILTIGTSSITLNGNTDTLTVPNLVVTNNTTGVTASGVAITVRDGGGNLGNASIIDFGDNLSVSLSAGIATITGSASGSSSQWVTTASGIHTLSNVGIGTTNATSKLTVKGNTSLETLSVSGASTFFGVHPVSGGLVVGLQPMDGGNINLLSQDYGNDLQLSANGIDFGSRGDIIFYRKGSFGSQSEIATLYSDTGNFSIGGILSGAGATITGTTFTNQLHVSGVSTLTTTDFTGHVQLKANSGNSSLYIFDDNGIYAGNGSDLRIWHNSSDSISRITEDGGQLIIDANPITINHSGSTKFQTIGAGVTVTGTTFTNQLSVSGVTTTETLNVGTGGTVITTTAAGLVGIGTTNPTSTLTVKGNTSLETLSVSGVSTFASRPVFNNGITVTSGNIYGSEKLVLSGGTGSDTYFYNGGFSYSDFIFYTLQTNSTTFEIARINKNGVLSLPGGGLIVSGVTTTATLNVGTAVTANNSGIQVVGIVTATSFSGSNTLKSRTTVIGVTTSIANNGIGNTNIAGFKSYALMKVGLSTAGWLRIYTDSTSRANDVSRSVGIDPTPGSGVIAEVVTTGISTNQIITPFVMGGNLDDPSSTTIYAAITNLSGSTQPITANLTILQLEA